MLSDKIHDVNLHTFLFYHFGFSRFNSRLFHSQRESEYAVCVRAFTLKKYSFLIHLKHLGRIQNEYTHTVGSSKLYGQNIKNNSNVLSQRNNHRMNEKRTTYAHTVWTAYNSTHTHHKKKSKNKYCSTSSYDWDFIGCKVIPTGSYALCV